jgi:6,7-dimethyl-8-ribityllumazine synthase
MATEYHNLSDYDVNSVPSAKGMKVGIVVSEWNTEITGALLEGASKTLIDNGVKKEDILVKTVPGSFELIYGAQLMTKLPLDAVIAIGCVIRGETPHFDYICQGTTAGLAHLNATQNIPVIYGLITANNMQQAKDRSGGRLGNKGDECAVTAIKMADYRRSVK